MGMETIPKGANLGCETIFAAENQMTTLAFLALAAIIGISVGATVTVIAAVILAGRVSQFEDDERINRIDGSKSE